MSGPNQPNVLNNTANVIESLYDTNVERAESTRVNENSPAQGQQLGSHNAANSSTCQPHPKQVNSNQFSGSETTLTPDRFTPEEATKREEQIKSDKVPELTFSNRLQNTYDNVVTPSHSHAASPRPLGG